MDTDELIPIKTNFDRLTAYQKGECIYDITYYFAHTHLVRGDRTVDQMIQAARSDYLRVRNQELWAIDSEKGRQCRRVCAAHNDSAFYRAAIKDRNATAIANIAITLIFQCDRLLRGLIERLKKEFLQNGGIREQMTRARLQDRKSNNNNNKNNK